MNQDGVHNTLFHISQVVIANDIDMLMKFNSIILLVAKQGYPVGQKKKQGYLGNQEKLKNVTEQQENRQVIRAH